MKQSLEAALNFEVALNRVLDAILEKTMGNDETSPASGFPVYSVIFRESGNVVQVLAVAHHARKPGYWLSRLQH